MLAHTVLEIALPQRKEDCSQEGGGGVSSRGLSWIGLRNGFGFLTANPRWNPGKYHRGVASNGLPLAVVG